MKKKHFTLTILGLVFCLLPMHAQSKIDHYETIMDIMTPPTFYTGTSTPATDWKLKTYTPGADWQTSIINVVGYSSTLQGCNVCGIANAGSTIYARTRFIVTDSTKIETLIISMYFMDGIVLYLNGAEVYRSNLGQAGSAITNNQNADSTIGFDIFNKEYSPSFSLKKEAIKNAILNGENILAIELHNDAVDKVNAFYQIQTIVASMNDVGIDYVPSQPTFPFSIECDSSEIPIALLDVPSDFITDSVKVPATLRIIDNGPGKINHITDTQFSYKGNIGIERRGSSSAYLPKHSYGFTTLDNSGKDTSVTLLGMPKENDWILKGEIMDRSLIRDQLTFDLARKMGHYAPRYRFCELYHNGTHVGLFAIVEKIKRDSLRVDIAKLKANDIAGLDVTGGYILKLDKINGSVGGGFTSKYKTPITNIDVTFQYEYPKGSDINTKQKDYISGFMNDFETALRSDNFKDPVNGYRKYISVKSFIDYMISQELGRNIDGYRLSAFMYKEKDKIDKKGKLHMGPLWDFNLAYGYSGSLCGGTWAKEGWAFDYNGDCPDDSYYIPFWWDRLHQDPSFREELKVRWDELRKGPLQQDSIYNHIDKLVAENKNPIKRNFEVWNDVFRSQIMFNMPYGTSYDYEITILKEFISTRLAWLDQNMPSVREEIIYAVGLKAPINYISQVKAYPVPFRTNITFEYAANGENEVIFSVSNIYGQLVYKEKSYSTQGLNYIYWNGSDAMGNNLKSGIYIYTIEINNQIAVREKIVKY